MQNVICIFPSGKTYIIPVAIYQLDENFDKPDISYTRSVGESVLIKIWIPRAKVLSQVEQSVSKIKICN